MASEEQYSEAPGGQSNGANCFSGVLASIVLCFVVFYSFKEPPIATVNARELLWSYDGSRGLKSNRWGEVKILDNQCGGKRQSPIKIDTNCTKEIGGKYPIRLLNYGDDIDQGIIKFGVEEVELKNLSGNRCISEKHKDFCLEQIDFHWGNHINCSEHGIDSRNFALEMHLYHRTGSGASGAIQYAVVAILFEMSTADNQALDPLLSVIVKASGSPKPVTFTSLRISGLLPMVNGSLDRYYSYQGSATIPPCTQNHVWYVLADVLNISEAQMTLFRSLRNSRNGHPGDNCRPRQPLNGRIVYRSFESDKYTGCTR